jgi:hypothetical protein
MRAKIKHRRAASPRRPGIARLRKQAILFRKFVDRTLKKALRAAPGAVTLTAIATFREPGGSRKQVIRNFPPSPPSNARAPGTV